VRPSINTNKAQLKKSTSIVHITPTTTSIHVTQESANNEYIGISEGAYAFDINRDDGDLKRQGSEKFKITIDLFNNTHKLMTQHTLKTHITTDYLQISIADTREQDTDKRLAGSGCRYRIVMIQDKVTAAEY
jgi:hypothetical protein